MSSLLTTMMLIVLMWWCQPDHDESYIPPSLWPALPNAHKLFGALQLISIMTKPFGQDLDDDNSIFVLSELN